MTFAEIYYGLLRAVLECPVSANERTKSRIRELAGGASFGFLLADDVLPTCGLRRTRPRIAAAEAAWCVLGHNHVDWLRRYTKVWDQFADVMDCVPCDGTGTTSVGKCANCTGSGKTYWLEQAYGYRWRHAFGVDQLAVGLERLRADPSDRRVWISSWHPGEDILMEGQKTVPCPVGFTLSVTDGRLNSTLMIRSSDLYMGLPYDVMRHALVMRICASSLVRGLGHMRVALAHPHLYEAQWPLAEEMVGNGRVTVPDLKMPGPPWGIDMVYMNPDKYVDLVSKQADALEWPAYDPRSEVVR